jgi:hypothetical protein
MDNGIVGLTLQVLLGVIVGIQNHFHHDKLYNALCDIRFANPSKE